MSSHRTIDDLARQAAAVTREATERRAVPSADVEVFAARLRPRKTLRVAAAALATVLGIATVGTLASEVLESDVPVIADVPDREVVEAPAPAPTPAPAPAPAVISDGNWEWDWALSLVTDPEMFAGPGPARASGIAIPREGLVVAVGVDPSLSGQPRPGVWVSRDAGASWRAVALEAIELPEGHADTSVVMNDIVASGPRLVAVGTQADEAGERGVVWVSDDDGDSWQVVYRTSESASAKLVAVETSGDPGRPAAEAAGFIAVGSYATGTDTQTSTAAVWSSQDGTDWSQPQLLPESPPGVTPSDIAADRWPRSSRLVVVGGRATGDVQARDGETRAWISVDHGASWRAEPVGDDVDLTAVVHVSDHWLAVGATRTSATDGGDRDAVVYTSRDGADWERAADPLGALTGSGAQVPHAVTYGEGFDPYVVVGVDDGRPAIWVSPDRDLWRRLQSEELLPAGTRSGITAVGYWGRIIAIGELSGASVTELAVWRSVSKESAGGNTGGVIAELFDEPPPIELADDAVWTSPPGVSRDEAVRQFAAAAFGWDDPTLPESDGTSGLNTITGPEGATVKLVLARDDGTWTIRQIGDGADFQMSSDGVLTLQSPPPLDAAKADLFIRTGGRTWHLELSGYGLRQRQVDLVGSGLPTGGLRSVLLVYRDDTGAVVEAESGHR
jgi:hypothetical protein